MRQFKITTQNMMYSSPDDCVLSPDDPVHEFIAASIMGGLGADARLAELRMKQFHQTMDKIDQGKVLREMGVTPDMPEWTELWNK